jgi:DNA-binding CsgD family transcriptional regulator
MDQVVSDFSPAPERLEQLVTALGSGIILVDADGNIVWMDATTRRRVNGGLQDLEIPTPCDGGGLDCFVSRTKVPINGEQTLLCVIQETAVREQVGTNLAQAIEAILADTSWFTRAFMERLKGWGQTANCGAHLSDLDSLTDREWEILGLICEGLGDGEISKILNVSRNTVRNHVASLYRKIGVNRRSAAIIWGRERGITKRNGFARNRMPRRPRAVTEIRSD